MSRNTKSWVRSGPTCTRCGGSGSLEPVRRSQCGIDQRFPSPPIRSRDLTKMGTPKGCPFCYSHSMVPGGLLVMSTTTRFTSGHSLVIRFEIFSNSSVGSLAQSAVMASSLVTGRSTIG